MSSWHPDCYQRAAAYVTDPTGRLLVFEHVDVDAGSNAFHLRLEHHPPDDEWEWHEDPGGAIPQNHFTFRWVALEEAERVLWPHQAMWVNAVRVSLRSP